MCAQPYFDAAALGCIESLRSGCTTIFDYMVDHPNTEVYDAIEHVYVLDPTQRRLFTVANLLPRALAGRLHKWVEGRG